MQQQFKIDGVVIKAPDTYKPVFATTSTEDSGRTQDLVMNNVTIGTVAGYDLSWGKLEWEEIATILNAVLNKKKFVFHHKDPTVPGEWIDKEFYVSNFTMEAQTLVDEEEKWNGLTFNVRSIYPI